MSTSRQPSGSQRGAQAVAHRDERRRRRRGLLWLLLALLLAAVAAAIVLPLALNGNDDEKQASSRARQSRTTGSGHAAAGDSGQRTAGGSGRGASGNSGQRAADDSGQATAGAANGTASDKSGQGAANDSGQAAGRSGGSPSLTASGASLVARPSTLSRYVGRDARGRAVVVQKVVSGNGFWIGTSRRSRVYVEYGGRVGPDETRQFRPRVGARVHLVGPVRAAPRNPARTLKLGPADAKLVRRQGAFINADRVKRAA
jgi:hypothetical protein